MTHQSPPSDEAPESAPGRRGPRLWSLAPGIVLLLILVVAGYLRFVGLNWDDFSHPHPDERFLTMVETALRLPDSLGQYFRTDESPLNPHNADFGFFVYGTLPIFIVRLLAEGLHMTGYDQVHLVGRAASALFDLLSILLVFCIGSRLYRRRVGLVAAAFAAFSVLLIQHAHFFVVDPFANTFILLGFYFAVRAMDEGRMRYFWLFGLAVGMAMACKISAAPLAGLVLLVLLVWLNRQQIGSGQKELKEAAKRLAVAALASFIAFRLFQPYAFAGTSFFDIRPNPKWILNLRELSNLSAGGADFPPAWQWANRAPILFAWSNLVLWGMGIPLGVMAWAGWAWALARMIRGEWRRHLLPVVWTGAYFVWQSVGFSKNMRYEMPVYPLLAILAAWALWHAWDLVGGVRARWHRLAQVGVALLGSFTLLATGAYAFAFSSIYMRPEPRVAASSWIYRQVPSVLNMVVETSEGRLLETLSLPNDFVLPEGELYPTSFVSLLDGEATAVLLPHVSAVDAQSAPQSLAIGLYQTRDDELPLASASYDGGYDHEQSLEIPLDRPVTLHSGQTYWVKLQSSQPGGLALHGSVIISETSWDLGLPMRVEGKDGYGGMYGGVNQELYWPDDEDSDASGVPDKLERLVQTLAEGDYLAISSNRQYGSLTRVPVRFPLTIAYYRALLGCPEPQEVWRCAARAQPGAIQGLLGYRLVAVFENNPRLGSFEVSDQGAEEAFTVYDHPKVLIFAKEEGFSEQQVRDALGEVDVSRIVNVLPNQAGSAPRSLMLPQERWEEMQAGGTWSELFSLSSLLNKSQILAVVAWWALITLFGVVALPLVRVAFPGLADGGYPFARIVGLLLVAWLSWLLGNVGVPFLSTTIALMLLLVAVASALIAWRDRSLLASFFKLHRREILWTEVLALAFFLLDLGIRLANPDLWHPYKGGEKPMDFSYLNAVIKSVSFPPYDPWFAGGYINYYYFGFVLLAIPIKLLGIDPSVAYNLAIPTLFSLLALGAYGVGYNLSALYGRRQGSGGSRARLAGIAAALALVVLGNLGTGRMIYDGFQRMGTPSGEEPAPSVLGLFQAAAGAVRGLTGDARLPYSGGEWYWNPSRAIPAAEGEPGPITEFPFFTFLYADLHAHMISLPLTVTGVAWGISWLLDARRRRKRRWFDTTICLAVGGLVLGSLRATNTWDLPLYLGLGAAMTFVGGLLSVRRPKLRELAGALGSTLVLVGFSFLFFQPYARWYGQGYTAIEPWRGSRTPLDAYLTVHGLFLFVILTWMAWETREWMASTPLSALGRLRPYAGLLAAGALLPLAGMVYLVVRGYAVAWVGIPTMVWACLLLLRRDLPLEKKVVLVLTACAVALTFAVEIVVLRGDIGRMNTVFKFYLQVWTLLSLSAAAALVWLIGELNRWHRAWRAAWTAMLWMLVVTAALYPLTAAHAKMADRMARSAPHSLDGMAFMLHAIEYDLSGSFPLHEDYQAIRWMQETVKGSPVIVEANIPEYRWGSRFTIYTGLPGVLGWNWHQRQQRVVTGDAVVTSRALAITSFYMTRSEEEARQFLEKYGVRYVVVGRLERLYYGELRPCFQIEGSPDRVTCDLEGRPYGMVQPELRASECQPLESSGEMPQFSCPTHALDKFNNMVRDGTLREAFREGETVIYEVLP